jgi:hypothetical protein
MSEIDTLIGEAVHRAMWRRRLQQIDVAPRAGMTQSALSKKIRGLRPWSVEDIYRVAWAMDVDPGELLVLDAEEVELLRARLSEVTASLLTLLDSQPSLCVA